MRGGELVLALVVSKTDFSTLSQPYDSYSKSHGSYCWGTQRIKHLAFKYLVDIFFLPGCG